MQALVVILIAILIIFVVVSVVLVVMVIKLSRDISRTQQNIRKINQNVDDTAALTSLVSSIYGFWQKNMPKKKSTRKKVDKEESND